MSNRKKITCECKTCISAMLLQSDINKWIISQLSKLDKLYVNSESTRLLERSKNYFIEYKKQIFPNDSHIHLRACDDESSYHCSSQITGSNIPKLDCILNCCSRFPMMNAPFLESSEQPNSFLPESLQKIEFRIFQNISKCSLHGLRPFKHKNICDLCDIISDKDKKVRIMVKNYFVIRDEVIDIFRENHYIPTIEKLSFCPAHVRIVGSMECGKTRKYFSAIMHQKTI